MRESEAAHDYTPIIIKYRVVKLYKESSPCVYKGGVGRKIFRKTCSFGDYSIACFAGVPSPRYFVRIRYCLKPSSPSHGDPHPFASTEIGRCQAYLALTRTVAALKCCCQNLLHYRRKGEPFKLPHSCQRLPHWRKEEEARRKKRTSNTTSNSQDHRRGARSAPNITQPITTAGEAFHRREIAKKWPTGEEKKQRLQ